MVLHYSINPAPSPIPITHAFPNLPDYPHQDGLLKAKTSGCPDSAGARRPHSFCTRGLRGRGVNEHEDAGKPMRERGQPQSPSKDQTRKAGGTTSGFHGVSARAPQPSRWPRTRVSAEMEHPQPYQSTEGARGLGQMGRRSVSSMEPSQQEAEGNDHCSHDACVLTKEHKRVSAN